MCLKLSDDGQYNRFIRWSRLGVFNKIFASLAATSDADDVAVYFKKN